MGDLKKPLTLQTLNRVEQRAANLDLWVKQHLAEQRSADQAKKSRLKGLRLALEALREGPADSPPEIRARRLPKPQAHRVWISSPPAAKEAAPDK